MFFLHHSQVDRLLAFWCSIHTDYVPGSDIDKDVNIDTGNHCISYRSIAPLIPGDWILDRSFAILEFKHDILDI